MFGGQTQLPDVTAPKRGGLYTSLDYSAVLAENFHYQHASLATAVAQALVIFGAAMERDRLFQG